MSGPHWSSQRHASRYSSALTRKQRLADVWISLFARNRFYPFWSFVHELSLHGMGVLNYRRNVTGELTFLRWLSRASGRTEAVPWVLDVGANVGDYAADVREALPNANIVCFEPHPRTLEKLRSRAATLRLDVVGMAVSRAVGDLELFDYADVPGGSEHASLHREVFLYPPGQQPASFRVPVTTIDQTLTERGIGHVRLLKIDTEGHELAVLEGSRNALQAGAIDIVQLEFNEMNVVSRTFYRDLLTPLAGYRMFRMLPDGLLPLSYSPRKAEIFGFQNVVAIRNELADELAV